MNRPEQAVQELAAWVKSEGGRALLVGGCVRDSLLGRERKDFDVEVFGLEASRLEAGLRARFAVLDVGKSFGVLKLKGLPIDVALPRRETKIARGHRGFAIDADPQLSLQEAALRRDLTLNALYEDPLTGEVLDPLGGKADLAARTLRHCSDRFSEDPLRLLRVMQFAARFDFDVADETLALCRALDLAELPRERVEDEWRKLLLQGVVPSRGLKFLRNCGALRFYPEIQAMDGTPQNPEWHPEGDVFVHTMHCLDHFARRRVGDDSDWLVGLGVLCHDFGKPATTQLEGGIWRSKGHSEAGVEPARLFLERLTAERDVIETVCALVLHHLRPFDFHHHQVSDAAVRRLATKVPIELLVRVARHDHGGRPPLPQNEFPAGEWLQEQAERLDLQRNAPKPLVLGRHLIALGEKPGPRFGEILEECFEAQLDGKFSDVEAGVEYLQGILKRQKP